MFAVPKDTQAKLDTLGFTYKIAHQGAVYIKEGPDVGKLDPSQPRERVKAEVVDPHTNAVVGEALGMTEVEALKKAVDGLSPEAKPKTPADLAAENAELKARLAQHEKTEPTIHNPGKPTNKTPAAKTTHVPVDERTDSEREADEQAALARKQIAAKKKSK